MRTLYRCLAILSLVAPGICHATLIGFEPTESNASPGDTIAIDIVATPENGELIGAFDFIVNFDPNVLAFTDLIFGVALNDDEFFCSLLGCRGFADQGGAISLFEVAVSGPLDNLQDGIGSIVLATLRFEAIAVGMSGLSFTGNILGQAPPFNLLGDEFGIPLPVLEPGTGSVTVGAAIPVPEPPTVLLMLTGLIGLTVLRRRRPIAAA